ncbi:MAG: hypothetical protein U1E29_05865 [Coriobacteriia bacterium]|nr:hypothetical protein [Coriobacteriia bacterium]
MRKALGLYRGTFVILVSVFFALGLLTSCAPESESGAHLELESTVREYNRLLAEGFRTLDMGVLEPVATPEQADKEFAQMSALGEAGIRLDSTLVTITFDSIELADNSAIVETTEEWDYAQLDIESDDLISSQDGVAYELRYSLVRAPDRWIVTSVESRDPIRPEAP